MVVHEFVARRGQLSDILCVGLFSPVASPLTVLLFQMVVGTFVRFRFCFRAARAGLSVTPGDGARRCCDAKQ
jgi:hypothetical protein